MTRVKRGNVARKKHKKILKLTEGFRGSSAVLFRTANQQRIKALKFSYRDRFQRKRDFRSVWITRINAAIRFYGINYNKLFHYLTTSNIPLNRKIVAQLSIRDDNSFDQLSHFLKF